MEYQLAAQAADRLGVTVRAVQKWAKAGKLHGAYKAGRDWMIPVSAAAPGSAENIIEISGFLPLMSADVGIGGCKDFIDSLPEDERRLALGEYYYYNGYPEKGLQTVEPFLDVENSTVSFSAVMICGYCALSLGRTHLVEYALKRLKTMLQRLETDGASPEMQALAVFCTAIYEIELHMPYSQGERLEQLMRYLPTGLRMYACYLLAYKAYFDQKYERMLGMIEIAVAVSPEIYTVAMTYLYVLGAVALMNLRQTERAMEYLHSAWSIAKPGEIYMPFVEHHGMLHGAVEVFFERKYPEEYARMVPMINSYNGAWRAMYNRYSGRKITNDLTLVEFNVAMLFQRGWKVREIAEHLFLSERTIKKHIQTVYEKLGISGRKELERYLQR